MEFSISKFLRSRALLALIAMTICSGAAQAVNLLTATPATTPLTCVTATGPGAAGSIIIKPVATLTTGTIAVTFTAPSGVVVTAPATTTLSSTNQLTGLTYAVRLAAGCAGATTGSSNVQFKAATVNDVTAAITSTVTFASTALVTAPTSVALTCAKTGVASWVPGAPVVVSVTSAATLGTPFTVDTVTSPPLGFVTVTPTTGGTATPTATTFTVSATAGCGGFAAGTTNTTSVHLLNSPAGDKVIAVSLQVLPPSPITATPSPASLSYVKGSGNPGRIDVALTAGAPQPFFSVDTSTLPIWLTVDSTTGTTPKTLRFSTTAVSDTLAPGTYNVTVRLKVSNYADLAIPITLLINNPAARLSLAEGTTRNLNWTVGQAVPAPFITPISSDSPIPYSITTGGALSPIISPTLLKGLAYSFGSPIPVTFDPTIFAAATPGSVLTGTVTFAWGSPAATIVVTFNVTVLSPSASLSGISPASIPTAASGQFTVVLLGSNFVPSTDPSVKTKVGIVVSGAIVTNPNISSSVTNSSSMILTFTIPAVADPALPFSPTGVGGTVNLGICNPVNGVCTIPTGTQSLTIGNNPIIQGVTSASSYLQVTPPTLQTVAPYDMLSVFGVSFCSSGGTGCSSSQVMYGSPDPVTFLYPTTLSPDAVSGTQRLLTVTFQTHAVTPVFIANAPLLFATNGQINLLVPSGVAAQIGSTVDMVVNFGFGSGLTLKSSTPVNMNVTATNPGIFTIGADGQGDGAILNTSYAIVAAGQEAAVRATAADSDIVSIYMTGLGVPDSIADNAALGTAFTWSTDCISPASYLTSLNLFTGGNGTTLDGSIIIASLLNTNRLGPCLLTTSPDLPSITFGGVAGTVTYAGWVANSIAGLYQVNAKLPGSAVGGFTTASGASLSTITAPVQLPVVITANSRPSQAGVNIWVAPRLKVTGPTGAGLTTKVGVSWTASNNVVIATEGTSTYRYAVTSGLLPSGVLLGATSGAITGTPAANTAGSYIVTVTATDSANVPVTGTVTFTLVVTGGLAMSAAGTPPFLSTFGTDVPAVTTVLATGGTYPYVYTITAPVTLPAGMTIDPSTGIVGITALTPAGNYHVTVLATDSSATPLTGSITFDVTVALLVTNSAPVSRVNGAGGIISTLTTTGNTGATGSLIYALDATTTALTWVTKTGGVITATASATAGVRTVTVTVTDSVIAPGAASAGVGTVTFTMTIT
jgi:hypothetical protein